MENLKLPIPQAWESWISTRWNELLQRVRILLNHDVKTETSPEQDPAKEPEPFKPLPPETGKMITALRSHAHKTIRQFKGPIDILTYSDMATITTREIIARINSNEFTTPEQAITAFDTTIQSTLSNYSPKQK